MNINTRIEKGIQKILNNSKIKVLVDFSPVKIENKMYYGVYFREGNKAKLHFYLLLDELLEGKYLKKEIFLN